MNELELLKTELIKNGSNFSDFGFKESYNGYTFDSLGSYSSLCGQFNTYIVKLGIIIIISYIVLYWFLWWFLNYGYKKLKSPLPYFGDLKIIDNRVYMDSWIKNKLSKFMLGYITVIVYITFGK